METPEGSLDDITRQVATLFSNGATLGTFYGYTDEDYEMVYEHGHMLYGQARYLDALKAFGFLVMHNPYERRYISAFAACFQMRQQYKEAITYYTIASLMDMTDPVPTFHTAECMIPLG